MRKIRIAAGLVVLAIAASFLRPGALDFTLASTAATELTPAAQTASDRGIIGFAYGDWGGLSSDTLRRTALPVKLANAALALQAARGDAATAAQVDLDALYRRFGLHSPRRIGNWPATLPAPPLDHPLGQVWGTGGTLWPPVRVTMSNNGCATCHSSVMYDADGTPDTSRVWLGMSNTSVNLEAYTSAVFTAVRDYGADTKGLMALVQSFYPTTDWRERMTLRWVILPALRAEIARRDAAFGQLLPFRPSLSGATNGIDSLRDQLGLIPPDTVVTQSHFASIPDVGGRLWRNRLLWTGTYATHGSAPGEVIRAADITDGHRAGLAAIIAYFTVPIMGVHPDVAEAHIDQADDVTAWMQGYAPQPFPGPIDAALAAQGGAVFARDCAACHGTYDADRQLVAFPNWQGDVGSDRARLDILTEDLLDTVRLSPYGQHFDVPATDGYSAPPLTGIWASAPYLANGSVPTLWHLLHPSERPAIFRVGGHRLDLARVGIDLDPPADYVPWAIATEIDTTTFGLGHQGHEAEFDGLSEADKTALLEYLKGL
jgi:hypothetical protein